jgi:hypothetical protein
MKGGLKLERHMYVQDCQMHSHYNPESSEHPHRLSWHETQDLTDHTVRRHDQAVMELPSQ